MDISCTMRYTYKCELCGQTFDDEHDAFMHEQRCMMKTYDSLNTLIKAEPWMEKNIRRYMVKNIPYEPINQSEVKYMGTISLYRFRLSLDDRGEDIGVMVLDNEGYKRKTTMTMKELFKVISGEDE